MKTSSRIQIITLSLIALVTLSFASKTFAAIDSYIIFTDKDGKTTKVTVDQDGNFSTPAMKAGTYTYSWNLVSAPTGACATIFGVGRGIGSPMGGSADREASTPSVSEIVVSYDVKAPRDLASGLSTGKRMHKPFVITKELDRSTPTLLTKMGTAVLDMDTDGITGTVSFKMTNGQAIKPSYDIKVAK